MRAILRVSLIGLLDCLVLIGVSVGWFWFYSRDLPDTAMLARFTPETTSSVSDPCLTGARVAIPYENIGTDLRNALSAAEGGEDSPDEMSDAIQGFSDPRDGLPALSFQISRTMFCKPSKAATRDLAELRFAAQLERRFTRRQLFTIAANRYSFGDGLVGVQAASRYYFHKDPADLSLAEAALLAGLVRAPASFSPVRHPDRAKQRRNDVLDAMVKAHSLAASDAESARRSALSLSAN
jgi:penicillin-binding protein 1A